MSKGWDGHLREHIASELDRVEMTEMTKNHILSGIHVQIKERRYVMRNSKKKFIISAAAAILALGTISAIAAGRIVGLSSSTNPTEAIHSVVELKAKADKELGADINIAEALSDGSAFKEGYITEVSATDKDGNTVMTYPEVNIYYGAKREISMSIQKAVGGLPKEPIAAQMELDYQGIKIRAKEDQYLFLPPDATPSEKDLKLEEEGKLFISYGSSKEERQIFKNVSWTKDGVEYLLFTFGNKSIDEMIQMAKAYIDVK